MTIIHTVKEVRARFMEARQEIHLIIDEQLDLFLSMKALDNLESAIRMVLEKEPAE